MNSCTYLLPLRRILFEEGEADEFATYFTALRAADCEVMVIDGSPPEVREQHHARWSELVRLEAAGIQAAVELASCEKIILAEERIRYTATEIEQTRVLLEEYEMVRPQSYFTSLPWWARVESARILIHRATLRRGDDPGTCAFRRSTILRSGPEDGDGVGDVEELVRTFARTGARIHYAIDFFVAQQPPSLPEWWEQRPRQAYAEFGRRGMTVLFLLLPILIGASAVVAGTAGFLLCLALLAIFATALACAGGARGEVGEYIPGSVCLSAPLWILERSLSTYWALFWVLRRSGQGPAKAAARPSSP